LSFYPKIGGQESIMLGLANYFATTGFSVSVLTETLLGNENEIGHLQVIRKPVSIEWLKYYNASDYIFEAGLSLKTVGFGFLNKKNWSIIHHTYLDHGKTWQGYFKNFLTLFTPNIVVSDFLKSKIRGKSIVIPNFYSPNFKFQATDRPNDCIFVGRLVSDKGIEFLMEAFKNTPSHIKLTICGDGPLLGDLIKKIKELELEKRIEFLREVEPNKLPSILNTYKMLIVPSRWEEPFGLVALEGLACGCIVVCTNKGGLPEAAGANGVIVEYGNIKQLANTITTQINNYAIKKEMSTETDKHLLAHSLPIIGKQYYEVVKQSFGDRKH